MLTRSASAVVPAVTANSAKTPMGASRTIQFQNRKLASRMVSSMLSSGALSFSDWSAIP